MRKLWRTSRRLTMLLTLSSVFFASAESFSCFAQATPASEPPSTAGQKSAGRRSPQTFEKYVGRYELEVGILPISTLDVTLEGQELWVKPSLVKKRRLVYKSRTRFMDEVEGSRYTFNKNDEGEIVSLTFQYEGSEYTARRVALPPPSLKGNTTFKLKGYAEAHMVVLAGSFNNWAESQLLFAREGGEWVCRIDLDPGVYTYKFIVDGNWLLDPSNPHTEEDAAGNINSVLVAAAQPDK